MFPLSSYSLSYRSLDYFDDQYGIANTKSECEEGRQDSPSR